VFDQKETPDELVPVKILQADIVCRGWYEIEVDRD
jgi:hypothetical protein